MIYYIVAKNSDQIFMTYVMPGLQQLNAQCAVVMDEVGKSESIFHKYNEGVHQHVQSGVTAGDIFCFLHEDVKILDPFFAEKAELVFKDKQDVGMLGVVGTSEFLESGGWWHASSEKLRGHIIQENNGMKNHLIKGPVGYYDDLVALDGLCFFIRSSIFMEDKIRFDEETYSGYDFYDIDICLSILEKGYRIASADILVEHKSIGDIRGRESWKDNKDKCIAKWKAKGYAFPLDCSKFNKYQNVQVVDV